jgi:GTP cyclohydrolase I
MPRTPADPVARHLRAAIQALGWPDDPEMARTPELWAATLRAFSPVPVKAPDLVLTQSNDLVALHGVPFHALCAHHLLPFFGHASVAYRPNGRLAALGALARSIQDLARRPTLQEALAAAIADHLTGGLAPRWLAVRLVGRHLCLEARGARSSGEFDVLAVRGKPGRDDVNQALRQPTA